MPPQSQSARGPDRMPWRRRLLALGLVVAGGVLLAGNLGVLPAGLDQPGQLIAPALAVGFGLWLVTRAPQSADQDFAIERSGVESADLIASTGLSDLEVRGSPGGNHLATGKFPAVREPGVAVSKARARLELSTRYAAPLVFAQRWSAALAQGLPWTLDLRTWTGDLDLDLAGLDVTEVRVRSVFGDAVVALPAAGQLAVDARLWAGDMRLRAPEGMAVRVKVRAGPLAALRIDERRYVQLAPGDWASPLFAVSPNRCTVTVSVWAGDLALE